MEERFASYRDWVEPAHSMVLRFYDDLLAIYRRIREKHQPEIDTAFDRAAREIGFVVATTLPVMFEVSDEGRIKNVTLPGEYLKETVFAREFAGVLEAMAKDGPLPVMTPESYNLHLIWFSALKVKLRTDWLEPVHMPVRLRCKQWELLPPPSRDWLEPAHPPLPWRWHCNRWGLERPHWLDWIEPAHLTPERWEGTSAAGKRESSKQMDPHPDPWRQKVMLTVLDEVYPELGIKDRIASSREAVLRRVDLKSLSRPTF